MKNKVFSQRGSNFRNYFFKKALPLKSLEDLRKFLKEFFKEHKVKIYLYGSRAKGNYKPWSDVDLAIECEKSLFREIALLKYLLEESLLPYKVDLVELNKVRPEFKENILGEAILWIDTSS